MSSEDLIEFIYETLDYQERLESLNREYSNRAIATLNDNFKAKKVLNPA